MTKIITLSQIHNLSLDDIIKLYRYGYRLEDNNITIKSTANPIVDKFVNFGKVSVSTGYNDTDTIIVLSSGDGSILPDPSLDGAFNIVWWNSTDFSDPTDDPNKEIIRAISRSGDTLVVIRGQEGTSQSSKNIPGKIYKMINSLTEKTITDLQNDSQSRVNYHALSTSGIHGTIGNIVGTSDSQILTNKTILDTTNNVMANSLKSATSIIDVSASSAPSTGQILIATSPTSATWQDLSVQNRSSFTSQVINAPTTGSFLPNITIPNGFALVVRASVGNTGQIYVANTIPNAISSSIPGNRNTLNAGDTIKLNVSNANIVAVAGSAIGNNVDILVEQ